MLANLQHVQQRFIKMKCHTRESEASVQLKEDLSQSAAAGQALNMPQALQGIDGTFHFEAGTYGTASCHLHCFSCRSDTDSRILLFS